MFLLLARFHARPMSYKALMLAFKIWHFQRKGSNTRRRGEFPTSVTQKCWQIHHTELTDKTQPALAWHVGKYCRFAKNSLRSLTLIEEESSKAFRFAVWVRCEHNVHHGGFRCHTLGRRGAIAIEFREKRCFIVPSAVNPHFISIFTFL